MGALDEPAIADLALRLSTYAGDAIPELDEPDLRADLHALARESLRSLFAAMVNEIWQPPDVPVAALEFTRLLVRRGHELPVLLQVYRLGQVELWRAVMEVTEREVADPGARMRLLTLMWERISLWLEAIIARQVTVYEQERERWLRGALAQRAQTIRALLADEEVDPRRAGQVLSHVLERHQLALVLWADDEAETGGAARGLEALAGDLASTLGAGRVLTTASSTRGLWAWVGTDAPADPARLASSPALAAAPAGVRVAVGRPGHGVRGFRDSHREALATQRIAMAGTTRRLLTTYDDVEVVHLLSQDEAAMRAFVERELAGLLGPGAASARLRQTALVFLSSGSNARIAAQQLGTHKNTVTYRVQRAEKLLGRPIEERRLPLELALTLADAFGERLLGLTPEPGPPARSRTPGRQASPS